MKDLIISFILCLSIYHVDAQVFSCDTWRDQHKFVMGKWSQLFYEIDLGITNSKSKTANFIYLSLGYGKPTTSNAWRKFLPNSKRTAPASKDEMLQRSNSSTSGLHAGTVGLGYKYYFNHVIGFHVQAGWAFIADFGSRDEDESLSSNDESEGEQSTFLYNSVPIQLGIDFNLWKHLEVQVGATYMWKEIPIITVGLGVAF